MASEFSNWLGACPYHQGLAPSRATAKNTEGSKPAASRSEFTEAANIGAVKTKSTWKPPYKSLAFPELGWKTETNFRFAQGKTGVYLIKRNGQLIYVGAARNVYKAMLRHFEQHKGECYENGHCNKQRYFDDYEKNEYLVRVVLTNTPKQAFALEAALINRYKPRDNAYIPELFDPSVLKEFTEATPETFDKAPF